MLEREWSGECLTELIFHPGFVLNQIWAQRKKANRSAASTSTTNKLTPLLDVSITDPNLFLLNATALILSHSCVCVCLSVTAVNLSQCSGPFHSVAEILSWIQSWHYLCSHCCISAVRLDALAPDIAAARTYARTHRNNTSHLWKCVTICTMRIWGWREAHSYCFCSHVMWFYLGKSHTCDRMHSSHMDSMCEPILWVCECVWTGWVFSSCPSSFVLLMLPHSSLFWLEHRCGDFQSRLGPSDALTLHYPGLIPQRSVFLLTFNFLCASMGAMASDLSLTGFAFAVLLCSCNWRDNCNSRYINKD